MDEPRIPASALAALAAHVLGTGDLGETLRGVCSLATKVVQGADEASVTLLTEGKATTLGATHQLAIDADEKQYEAGSGPCLDAALASQVVIVPDLAAEERWSAAAEMAAVGARSSLSLPLPVQGEVIGALNVYARDPGVFNDGSSQVGEEFASYAAVAVANAVSYNTAAQAAKHMQAAMESRAVIEQAKGILMGTTGCDPEAAFHLLVQQSQHQNRKLREIAADLVQHSVRTGSTT